MRDTSLVQLIYWSKCTCSHGPAFCVVTTGRRAKTRPAVVQRYKSICHKSREQKASGVPLTRSRGGFWCAWRTDWEEGLATHGLCESAVVSCRCRDRKSTRLNSSHLGI